MRTTRSGHFPAAAASAAIQPPPIVATMAGTLVAAPPPRQRLHVASRTRRYTPAAGDVVIGTILDRNADGYRVTIGAAEAARLPGLAFAGATKRNKPALAPGALLFGRVAAASRAAEAELTCVEVGESVSWLSGEATYGELVGGNVVRVGLDAARRLMAGGGGGEGEGRKRRAPPRAGRGCWPPSARRWRLRWWSASTGGCGSRPTRRPTPSSSATPLRGWRIWRWRRGWRRCAS